MSILLLLSNKEAKSHSVKKFSWLSIGQNKTTVDRRMFELSAVTVVNRGDGVDQTGREAAAVKKFEVEETKH